ncbi:hypothetical protein, partial [Streptomyces sp. SID3343]|uniref:hypothetical protein n=1 Tax=Streptomyces sp. SID3343 TaxID=2690260 RepID=UPI00136E412E
MARVLALALDLTLALGLVRRLRAGVGGGGLLVGVRLRLLRRGLVVGRLLRCGLLPGVGVLRGRDVVRVA